MKDGRVAFETSRGRWSSGSAALEVSWFFAVWIDLEEFERWRDGRRRFLLL